MQLAFFSYAHQDAEFALRLAKDLRAGGAAVWIDRLDIKPGERWDQAIEDALAKCRQLILILSPSAVESTNVMDEVSLALEERKTVLPVIYRNCKIPFRLRRLQYVDLTLNYEAGLGRILETLEVAVPGTASAPRVAAPQEARALQALPSTPAQEAIKTPPKPAPSETYATTSQPSGPEEDRARKNWVIPPSADSRTQRAQEATVAIVKEPTTPVRETGATPSQPPIPPVESEIAASKTELSLSQRKWIRSAAAATIAVVAIIILLFSLPHHNQGTASEQYNLGVRYQEGNGVTRDFGKAAELFQKAADQGYAPAQTNLGWLYKNGDGVTKDLDKAKELFRKAAAQGNALAQAYLAELYQNGQGVTQDFGQAAELYQKAADQGWAPAQDNLGVLYQNGQGVTKDFGKAAELYQKAADQGYAAAQNHLGALYQYGAGVTKDLGKAAELYQKAADQGYAPAMANLKSLPRD